MGVTRGFRVCAEPGYYQKQFLLSFYSHSYGIGSNIDFTLKVVWLILSVVTEGFYQHQKTSPNLYQCIIFFLSEA